MAKNDIYGIGKLLKGFSGGDITADFLSNESISNVEEYIDTGNYALNAILSGSVFGGVPVSRVTGFAGPTGSCKTFVLLKIVANAQKKGMPVFYFDSENAVDELSASRLGCDIDNLVHITAITVEQVQEQSAKILNHFRDLNNEVAEYNKAHEDKKDVIHPLIIIDSIGNLLTKKELSNSIDGNIAADQGLRAKTIGTMLRVLTNLAAATRSTVCFSNHTYSSTGEMYPSLVKAQSGGSKVLYLASVLVQMSQVLDRTKDNTDAQKSNLSAKTVGRKIHIMTVKNRFIVGELECEMHLNYKSGIDMYSGLTDLAIASGYVVREGLTYYFASTGEKIGKLSTFDNAEFWKSHLLDLDAVIKRETELSNVSENIGDEKNEPSEESEI